MSCLEEEEREQTVSNGLTRRRFLTGASGMVAAGALAACTRKANADESWLPAKWDYEADLVAIGAGGGGLAAAISGRDEGLEVIVLEQLAYTGGSSAICGGGIGMCGTPLQKQLGIDDTPEKYFADITKNSGGAMSNEANIKAHVYTVTEMYDWLTNLGLKFPAEGLLRSQGNNTIREHHVEGGPGPAMKILYEAAVKKGATILLETECKELIQNPVTKRVLGVMAESNGKKIYLKARRGVLLSTGSIAANKEMLAQYRYGLDKSICIASPGNTGSGHKMAMQLGAVLLKAGFNIGVSVASPRSKGGADISGMFVQGAILVNKEGKRFINEELGINLVSPALSAQTNSSAFQIYDQDLAAAFWDNPSNTYGVGKHVEKGLAIKAETIEEAAKVIGAPANVLKETIDKYNSDLDTVGYDTAFNRKYLNAGAGKLVKIVKAPFYVFETVQAVAGGSLGLWENDKYQVLNQYGEAIPGLYTAGAIVQYAMLGVDTTYWVNKTHCGFGWCGAMNHGRLVAKALKDVQSWEEA